MNVDQLVSADSITRTVAQIEIEYSNSMIEMLFQRLKHRYLFTIPLANSDALEKGVDFYLTESNNVIPHSALQGATPEQVITGQWTAARILELQARVSKARQDRIDANRQFRCLPCLT